MPLCSKGFNKKDGIPPPEFNIIDSENGVHPALQAGLEHSVCAMYYEYRTASSRRGTRVTCQRIRLMVYLADQQIKDSSSSQDITMQTSRVESRILERNICVTV